MTQDSKFKTQDYNLRPKADLKSLSYKFSLDVIDLIGKLPEKRVYWVIGDQLLRSATSIGANIVEAKSSSSRKDFIRYFEIALKSCNETRYWLSLVKDSQLFDVLTLDNLIQQVMSLGNMLGSSLITLKGKRL